MLSYAKRMVTACIDRIFWPGTIVRFERSDHSSVINHGTFEIKTKDGFLINIFCHEANYFRRSSAQWIKSKRFRVYHVFARCSHDTPELLKGWFSQEMHLPCMVSVLASTTSNKRAAIEAYIHFVLHSVMSNIP